MLMIQCPCCGATAEEADFHCGGEAHIVRLAGDNDADADLGAYLFERANPKGLCFERWRHQYGCGKWFHLARDSRTMEIFGVYDIKAPAPPAEIVAEARRRIAARGLPEHSNN
ncbi:MAG: sarcosine oxidase subunit delta [Neomegalonema sp.]|nr:sarcosine oxidase subunit delta [Neomegalonema sp.]